MEKQESKIEMLERKLAEMEQRIVPRVCATCDWFKLRPPEMPAPHNRYCKYPGDIKLKDSRCIYWKVGDDLWKRQPKNITV